MNISEEGVRLIKQFEGCRLTAYQDSVGVWTCGWGTTGPDVKEGVTFTHEQAEKRLRNHLELVEQCVNRCVTVSITQGQFDALCSFVYNLGCGNLMNSTLLKKLNRGDRAGAAAEFPRWVRAGGKVLRGLIARREAEQAMFGYLGAEGRI